MKQKWQKSKPKLISLRRRNEFVKYFRLIMGLMLLATTFLGGVIIRDRLHAKWLKQNVNRIQLGMSEAEVIGILGSPVNRHMTDGPGEIWCYTTDSFDDYDENCGPVAIDMSPSRVTKVLPVTP